MPVASTSIFGEREDETPPTLTETSVIDPSFEITEWTAASVTRRRPGSAEQSLYNTPVNSEGANGRVNTFPLLLIALPGDVCKRCWTISSVIPGLRISPGLAKPFRYSPHIAPTAPPTAVPPIAESFSSSTTLHPLLAAASAAETPATPAPATRRSGLLATDFRGSPLTLLQYTRPHHRSTCPQARLLWHSACRQRY